MGYNPDDKTPDESYGNQTLADVVAAKIAKMKQAFEPGSEPFKVTC